MCINCPAVESFPYIFVGVRINVYCGLFFSTYKDSVVDYLNSNDTEAKLDINQDQSQSVFSLLKVNQTKATIVLYYYLFRFN